jgi:hypothetical protein
MFDTLHLWSSKILTMVCDFIGYLVTISLDVEMLHNNILGAIEIYNDEKEQHNAFEKAWASNSDAFG